MLKKKLTLPLVKYVADSFEEQDLENVAIIGAQHLLGTTTDLFRQLISKGLKPNNVFLIGKCYSSSRLAINELKDLGIYVCPSSTSFDSHQEFDSFYRRNINQFLEKTLPRVKECKKVVILDDGGILIRQVHAINQDFQNYSGVEQTSSGFNALKNFPLEFPVINVARSDAKLLYESPMIADAVASHIEKSLVTASFSEKKVLILGGGAIGISIYQKVKNQSAVEIFDTNTDLSSFPKKDLPQHLLSSDLIIGCTGQEILNKRLFQKLKPGAVLASASSSDREFSAFPLFRTQLSPYRNPHRDIQVGNITLLNSGFPVNFDGKKHSVPPKQIQLTRALLAAGVLQAISEESRIKGLVDLDYELQRNILSKFFDTTKRLQPSNRKTSKEKKLLSSPLAPLTNKLIGNHFPESFCDSTKL